MVFASFAGVFVIAFFSAHFASRVQVIILAIVGMSLLSVFMGGFPSAGQQGAVYTPQLIGEFADGLDAIAPLITMFFLPTYAMLNAVVLIEQTLSMVTFRPNILFLPLFENEHGYDLQSVLDNASQPCMGRILLAHHRVVELGREQIINVWMREQGPDWKLGLRLSNLDLSLLLTYQLSRNWKGQINLCMAVEDGETTTQAGRFLEELVTLARLPKETKVHILQADFLDPLNEIPSADINFFGLADQFDREFVEEIF